MQNRREKLVINSLLVLILILGMHMTSFAKWYQNERGWQYRNTEADCYISSRWAIIDPENRIDGILRDFYCLDAIGGIYCFDKDGYLREEQITPEGYLVDRNGNLIVDGKAVKVYTYTSERESPDWESGSSYIGRWIGICYNDEELSTKISTSGNPFELNIYISDEKRMYADFYELKNGRRVKLNTYDFIDCGGGKYMINTENGVEIFSGSDFVDSMNSDSNLDKTEEELYPNISYFRIIE